MEWLSLLMRWLHILSVAIVIGSTAFLRLVLQPGLANVSEESRRIFLQGIKTRLTILLHSAVAGVLVSGLYNTHLAWQTSLSPYPVIYAVKILLALVVLAVAILAFARRSPESDPPSLRTRWLTLGLSLGLVVMALSAYLRTLHQ